MANDYDSVAGKVREELVLDEIEEELEEFNDCISIETIVIATKVIARHILECAKELEDIGFNLEDIDY